MGILLKPQQGSDHGSCATKAKAKALRFFFASEFILTIRLHGNFTTRIWSWEMAQFVDTCWVAFVSLISNRRGISQFHSMAWSLYWLWDELWRLGRWFVERAACGDSEWVHHRYRQSLLHVVSGSQRLPFNLEEGSSSHPFQYLEEPELNVLPQIN